MIKQDMMSRGESADASLLLRVLQHFEQHGLKREGVVLLWLFLVLVRWLVGLHSYSGANTPPMFGDYEAQRHWMEITLNLPVSEWYFNSTVNDLLYWGLDYPPLTAYVSYLFGFGAAVVEPGMVELTSSRGYETATGKVFMRVSVLLCDLLLFFPVVYALAQAILRGQQWSRRMAFVLLVLVQPSLLLIDHGHFQYNNVCLGFTALALVFLWNDHEFLGSVAFCLALNFKQMALYYAPAFGVYLFAKCIYRPQFVVHLVKLAVAVIATFAVMWLPFCLYAREGETCASSVGQVLHRVFPFARGLFEDKVANVWCVLDLVLKLKRHVSPVLQMRLCTITTFVGFLPSVVDLVRRKPSKFRFLLALVNSSLAFFLFSFQVHEKTILLPLLPTSLLWNHNALLVSWFSFLSTFSMYFLLKKDGLIIPYLVLQMLFFCVAVWPALSSSTPLVMEKLPGIDAKGRPTSLTRAYVLASTAALVVLHLAQAVVEPPARYPHIFDYLFAAFSCAHFSLALLYCTYWQWTTTIDDNKTEKSKTE
ncbi:hypothetical protein Poli38472_002099 [Pythium oligandrum]|uniref:Alpha-1,3-glucosyltransferase n=1 Tax=Pythium oligandrum TaxID=41045 RepID=A0A8K1CIN0_PYTOL|nr:hypothetical protein Poli38472_002099 [Pythium oligandrum]|eukprot:TMW63158.1 hypothetical protein Poli38472_002099 [Pythium oligandrum]